VRTQAGSVHAPQVQSDCQNDGQGRGLFGLDSDTAPAVRMQEVEIVQDLIARSWMTGQILVERRRIELPTFALLQRRSATHLAFNATLSRAIATTTVLTRQAKC